MNKNRIVIVGTATALLLAVFAGCSGDAGEKEYNKAMKAWKKGDLVQARTLFEKATGRLSGNARKSEAYNDLGRVLWQMEEPQAAAVAFDEACTLSEAISDAWLNLALAQFHTGDLDGATKSLSLYLGEYPDSQTAISLQSLVAAKKKNWDQSSRLIAQVIQRNPSDPATQNMLALAELNRGQSSDQVIALLKSIMEADPGYTPAIYNLAVIYDQWRQDKASALHYYTAYTEKAGQSGTHMADAQKAIERLSTAPDTPEVDMAQAVKFMTEGARLHEAKKYTEAIEQFRKAIEINPGQKNAYYNMGLAYYSLQEFDEAVQSCQSAINIDPGFANARYMLALSYLQQKKWAYAEREAKALAELDAKRGEELLAYIKKSR